MLSGVMDYLVSRSRARSNGSNHNGLNAGGRQDGLLWHQDIGRLVNGEYSAAVIQANKLLEDQSQVESGSLSTFDSGPFGTFVGVYDGHGGVETSRYINKCLFKHLKNFTSEQKAMSVDVLSKTFKATEDGFVSFVREKWIGKPQLATVGSCCLVGVVCNSKIYIANAGDSRAVLGRAVKLNGDVLAIQLSAEHNASIESVRKELRLMHPNDSQIVVQRHNVWRVKGIIQVSRSIGDLFLKKPEFLKEPLCSRFRLPEFNKPILSAEPAVSVHPIHPLDQFIIFASDGLWCQLSNQEAVNLVKSSPRKGIAKRLVKAALREAARKREMRYSDMMKIERGVRRHFHDDITVVVLFLESSSNSSSVTKLSNMPVPSSNSSSVTKLSNAPVPSGNSSSVAKLSNTPVPSSNSSSVTKLSNTPVPSSNSSSLTKLSNMPVTFLQSHPLLDYER